MKSECWLFDTIDTDLQASSRRGVYRAASLDIEMAADFEELAKVQEMDGNFDDCSADRGKKNRRDRAIPRGNGGFPKGWKVSAEQLEAMPAAEKSSQLAAAWAALKRGKRPARPNDDLPKQEL